MRLRVMNCCRVTLAPAGRGGERKGGPKAHAKQHRVRHAGCSTCNSEHDSKRALGRAAAVLLTAGDAQRHEENVGDAVLQPAAVHTTHSTQASVWEEESELGAYGERKEGNSQTPCLLAGANRSFASMHCCCQPARVQCVCPCAGPHPSLTQCRQRLRRAPGKR